MPSDSHTLSELLSELQPLTDLRMQQPYLYHACCMISTLPSPFHRMRSERPAVGLPGISYTPMGRWSLVASAPSTERGGGFDPDAGSLRRMTLLTGVAPIITSLRFCAESSGSAFWTSQHHQREVHEHFLGLPPPPESG